MICTQLYGFRYSYLTVIILKHIYLTTTAASQSEPGSDRYEGVLPNSTEL